MNNTRRKSATLWAAWCSSSRRKLLWLLTAILLVTQVMQFDELFGRPHTASFHSAFPEFTVSGRHLQFSENQAPLSEEQRSKVEAITLFGGTDPLLLKSILEERQYPRLKSLRLMVPISAEELRLVARLPGLQSLTLLMSQGMSAGELSVLSEAESLTYLKVIEATGYDLAPDEIHWPPHVQQLCLQGPRGLPLRRFKELQTLPELRTLSVRLDPLHPTSELPEDVIATLQQFPSLQRLYLREMGHLYPDLVSRAQNTLPGIAVRPADYDRQRLLHAQVIMVLFGCWLSLILIQLSVQFVGPQSLLLPNYPRAHLSVAGGVFVLAVLLNVALVLYHGISGVSGLGLFGFAATFTWLMTRLYRSSEGAVPGFTQPFLAFPVLMFLALTGLLLIYFNPSDIDWWLRGHLPWWSVVLSAVGVYALADMARWMIELPRLVEAANRSGVPLGSLDIKGWQTWQLRSLKSPTARAAHWQEFVTGVNQRLELTLKVMPGVARRRRLWIACEQATMTRMMLMTVVPISVFTGVFVLWKEDAWNDPLFGARLCGGALGYVTMMSVIFPLMLLFQRHQTMAIEVLRPVSRQDWIRDWFYISGRRLLPAIISSVVLLGMGWWYQIVPIQSPAIWLGIVAVWAAVWFLLLGVGLWLISYRWAPYILIILFPIAMPLVMAFSVGPLQQFAVAWGSHASRLWLTAFGILILGGLSLRQACRRWWTWELAR